MLVGLTCKQSVVNYVKIHLPTHTYQQVAPKKTAPWVIRIKRMVGV